MITEDYVSFETAKLLKEKGFEGKMHTFYAEDGKEMESSYVVPSNFSPIYRTTLQMAMKWLRDVDKLCVVVKPYITEEGILYLFEIKEMNRDSVMNKRSKTGFNTYEEACEAAIKYCLINLI